MKRFIKIDYSSSKSYIFAIDDISYVYFDSDNGKYVLALKTLENHSCVEFFMPDDFSIDEFYLEIEDRFPF